MVCLSELGLSWLFVCGVEIVTVEFVFVAGVEMLGVAFFEGLS